MTIIKMSDIFIYTYVCIKYSTDDKTNKPELRLTPASLSLRASPAKESEPPNRKATKKIIIAYTRIRETRMVKRNDLLDDLRSSMVFLLSPLYLLTYAMSVCVKEKHTKIKQT